MKKKSRKTKKSGRSDAVPSSEHIRVGGLLEAVMEDAEDCGDCIAYSPERLKAFTLSYLHMGRALAETDVTEAVLQARASIRGGMYAALEDMPERLCESAVSELKQNWEVLEDYLFDVMKRQPGEMLAHLLCVPQGIYAYVDMYFDENCFRDDEDDPAADEDEEETSEGRMLCVMALAFQCRLVRFVSEVLILMYRNWMMKIHWQPDKMNRASETIYTLYNAAGSGSFKPIAGGERIEAEKGRDMPAWYRLLMALDSYLARWRISREKTPGAAVGLYGDALADYCLEVLSTDNAKGKCGMLRMLDQITDSSLYADSTRQVWEELGKTMQMYRPDMRSKDISSLCRMLMDASVQGAAAGIRRMVEDCPVPEYIDENLDLNKTFDNGYKR